MFLSLVMQLFFVAKAWALIFLKAIFLSAFLIWFLYNCSILEDIVHNQVLHTDSLGQKEIALNGVYSFNKMATD